MSPATIVAFWGVSFLLIVTPGAEWAYVIQAGLSHRSIAPALVGVLSGHLLATLVVAAGVAALLAQVPTVLTVLTVVGAIYLCWLGVQTLLHPPVPAADGEVVPSSPLREALKGFGICGLNPKVFLLFLAVLPQFTDATGTWPLGVQIMALGLVHIATCAVVYTVVGLSSRKVLRSRPTSARVVSRVSGGAMLAIGGLLLMQPLVS